jgi:hypothetical protein
MGKELGEDMGDADGLNEALEEEMASKSDEEIDK